MPYASEISRTNPTCILFLVDQSSSMGEPMAGAGVPKAQFVSDALNSLIAELVVRSAKEDSIPDYFHVGVIGYGTSVHDALGYLGGGGPVPLSRLANAPLRVEQRIKQVRGPGGQSGTTTVKFPVWVEPRAEGLTAMTSALSAARSALKHWTSERPASFPPIVVNLSDGQANDGDPLVAAQELRSVATNDGHVLLFNVFVSSMDSNSWVYPNAADGTTDRHARTLFTMSSALPPSMLGYAREFHPGLPEGARGLVFNADAAEIVRFLDIGTRVPGAR